MRHNLTKQSANAAAGSSHWKLMKRSVRRGGSVNRLHDSDDFLESSPDYSAVDCVCTCERDKFEIVVGVTLYGKSDTARIAYIGCKCVACGRVECYASWPRVDAPSQRFFGTMKQPQS